MKSKGFRLAPRFGLLCIGSTISTFCYALTIRAGIGLGPLFVAQDGLARTVHVSIGTSVMVWGVGLILLSLLLRSSLGVGTLVLPFFSGSVLNAILPVLPASHGWPLRVSLVVVSTWFMALGGALVIRASLGPASYDAVMLGLHRVLGRPLAPIRLAMELSVLACGWLLGGLVGVGTLITGLLIGPAMQFWLGWFGPAGLRRPDRTTVAPSGRLVPFQEVHRRLPARDAELPQDRRYVATDRRLRDEETLGHLASRGAFSHQLEDIPLPPSESRSMAGGDRDPPVLAVPELLDQAGHEAPGKGGLPVQNAMEGVCDRGLVHALQQISRGPCT